MSLPQAVNVSVSPDGEIVFVYSDELREALAGLGNLSTKRAGNVEPGLDGWYVQVVKELGGHTAGPFINRSEALAAEVQFVESDIHGVDYVSDNSE